jgi:hypothetical protein
MGVTWHELQETPASIVEDYLLVMEAEANAQRAAERESKRAQR